MTTKYTKEHEWVRVDGDVATVGITDFAQEQLGELVYVEPPEAGKSLAKGDEAAVVESVKAASEIYAPASGEVIEGNASLADEPTKVNDDPTGEGWVFKMKLSDASELDGLMDEVAYGEYIQGLD